MADHGRDNKKDLSESSQLYPAEMMKVGVPLVIEADV
jgi:hypothetical protein